jgi:hypothetical protein
MISFAGLVLARIVASSLAAGIFAMRPAEGWPATRRTGVDGGVPSRHGAPCPSAGPLLRKGVLQ